MKAKFITFVRGLKNGTPPRFQSYLKSLTLLLAMVVSVNAWGETYELYTSSTLTEGDYLIVGYQTSSSNYYAMNDTCTSNQYMGITSVSPSNNTITSTSSAIVWTISASTNGYYIKNGSNFLDDNATSSKNYAQLVSSATTTCEWNFAYNSTEKTWTITNYGTTTTRKTLSFNIGSTRVACYASIQSGNTCCYLYKKQSASVPTTITYHVGSTNGTVNSNVGTSLTTAMASVATTSCDDNSTTFMGWSTAAIDGKVQTAPSSLLASTATVTANMEVWAVWAKKTQGTQKNGSSIYTIQQSSTPSNPYVTTDVNGYQSSWSKSGTITFANTASAGMNNGSSLVVTLPEGAIATTISQTGTSNGWSTSNITLTLTAQGVSGSLTTWNDKGKSYSFTAANNDKQIYTLSCTTKSSKVAYVASVTINYTITPVSYSDYLTTCAPTYAITTNNPANGSIKFSTDGTNWSNTIADQEAGAGVFFKLQPSIGYEVNGAPTSEDVTITDFEDGTYGFDMPEKNVTVSASFTPATYQITYNLDDGAWSGEAGVATYTYGIGATLPTADDVIKANNTFLGWYVSNPAEIVTSIGTTETGDKSFIASWLPSGARDVTYSGDEQLNYTSNPQIVDKDDQSLTVTYSVNKGYTISAVAVTVDGSALTEGEVVFNDEQLTITPNNGFTGDVVITFTVVEKMFNVTWMANKTQFDQVQIQEGSKVSLPAETPSDVDGDDGTYKFQGWIVDEQYSNETTAPAYITNNTIEPTGDVTYYAVYAMKESSVVENSYVKGTKADLTEGQKVIIVNGNSKKALSGENLSNTQTNYRKAISVTITNNKISNTNANIVWTVSLENSKYIFKQGTNYLNSTGNNLYCNGNKDTWTITAVSGNAGYTLLSTGGSKYLEYYSDYTEFTCYTGSGNAFNMDFYIPEVTENTKNYRTRVAIIDHIAVNGTPVETKFVAGETFDATGLSIDVYYQDEVEPTNVTTGFTYAPTGALKTTDENITFTYQGKTVDLTISVSNTVLKIEVTTNPTKMEYNEGEQFNPEGMEVTATYDNDAQRVVTGYDYEPKGDLALGDKITISFGGQTTELGITINEATKTTVNWFVEGVKLTEGGQSTAVIPGKKVTVLPTEPTACTGNQFVGWTAVDANYYNATTAPTDLFKTLADAPTIGETETSFYAVFAQLTATPVAESTVYTSNIDNDVLTDKVDIGGSSDNQVVAKKLGTSNTPASSLSFTVPAGTTTITLHAAAWTGSSNATIQMSTEKVGVVITPSAAQSVAANTGATGNSPYSITPADGDFYTFTLSGVTEETTIKVANTGARVVLWGINTATTITSDYSTTCLAALAAPTIITAEGEYCGSVDVEITQPAGNPEGAKIMYSTNNETWNEYTAAVNITTSGTVYAKVVKAPKETEVVSATYTVYPAYTLAEAATAASATSQIACLTFTDLLVQARTLNEAFLKASDGQIVLLSKSSHGLQVGDKLVADNAHLNFIKSHDLLQLTSMDGIEKNGTGTPVADVKTITEITSANYGQLVKIMNVTYDATKKKFIDVSSNEIAVDAKFFVGGGLPSWPDGGKFNATGVVVLDNNSNAVIAPRNTDDLESLATPLPAPTNFAVASVNSYQASYSWTAVENNVGYTLYIYDGETEIYKSTTISKTRTDYAPTKVLEAGHTYTAKLVALGDKASYADSPAAETTVTTNPNAKLNWYVGGEFYTSTDASQEKVVTPEDPTSPCATNYENFVTWYNEEIDGQTNALVAANKVKAGDAAASQAGSAKEYNFYAVFGKIKTQGTDKYVAVTSEPTKWEGEYLIVHNDSVFNGSLTTLDAEKNGVVLTREEDGSYLASNANNYRFVIAKSTTKDEDDETAVYYTIQSASEYFIGGKDNSNGMNSNQKFATQTYDNILSWSEDKVEISSYYGNTYLTFNTVSNQLRFRYMTKDAGNLILYKRTKTNPQYSGYITTCPQTYTITIVDNTKGLVEAATTTEILKGAKVLLTATANAGYTKTGGAWVVKKTATSEVVENLVGNTNYLTMPDYDVTVDYNFQEIKDQFVDNLHGNTTIEKGGANYELPTLSDFSETTGAPSDAFKKFIGWSATSYDSGEPATEQPTILEGSQTATGATYFAVWYNQSSKYITEYCQTSAPANLHLVEEYHKATSVRIDWNNVDGADKYHIIVMDGEAETIADADVTESVYDLSGLTPGATYICTVKAHKDCWSDETEEFEFTTKENIQSYAVTINAEGGTYQIDPELEDGKIQEGATVTITNIAPTDADHYFFKELTVPEATDLTEITGGYKFTMPGKAVTINIVFAEYPTVTWKMEGQTYAVTSSVRQDNKFVVGTVHSAPENWKYKNHFTEFAGWMTNDDVENPEFVTTTTEVPVEGLVVNGAIATKATKQYQLVTDVANLAAGDELVIVGLKTSNSQYYAASEIPSTKDYLDAVTIAAPVNNMITIESEDVLVFTLGGTTDAWTFKANDKYLASSGTEANKWDGDYKTWKLANSSTANMVVMTSVQYTSGKFEFNMGSPRFRNYKGTQEGLYFYRYSSSIYDNLTINPQPDYGRTDLVVGNYGTVCVPYTVTVADRSGATFWNIETSNAPGYPNPTSVTIVQHEGDLVAGKPYIFYAEETTMSLFFSGDKYEGTTSVEANGLYGNLTDANIIINEMGYTPGYFFVLQQKLYECGVNCTVGPNRGWVQAAAIENMTTPLPAPRRVIGNPNGTPTGINNLNADGFKNIEGARKYFYNNQIMIVNEGRIYNAQGIRIQ